MKKLLSVLVLGSVLVGFLSVNAMVLSDNKSLNDKLTQIASDSSYEHGIGNGEYHETEVTQATYKIQEIVNNDELSTQDKIQALNKIASEYSYAHGTQNGEYHETEVTKLVFDVIEELKQ